MSVNANMGAIPSFIVRGSGAGRVPRESTVFNAATIRLKAVLMTVPDGWEGEDDGRCTEYAEG